MLNVLMTQAHEQHLYNLSQDYSFLIIAFFFLGLFLVVVSIACYVDTHDHKISTKVICCTIGILGVLLFLLSANNIVYNNQYQMSYPVIQDRRKIKHVEKTYPTLPCHQVKPKRVCSKSVKTDVKRISAYRHKKQLTKPMARRKYVKYAQDYKTDKEAYNSSINMKITKHPKLYDLQWWNFL